jgi:hypothetical protein
MRSNTTYFSLPASQANRLDKNACDAGKDRTNDLIYSSLRLLFR